MADVFRNTVLKRVSRWFIQYSFFDMLSSIYIGAEI